MSLFVILLLNILIYRKINKIKVQAEKGKKTAMRWKILKKKSNWRKNRILLEKKMEKRKYF